MRKSIPRLAACFAALAVLICSASPGLAGWLDGYTYRQEVTIAPSLTPGNLSGFPVLVKVADAGNEVFTHASGQDIVFTGLDGVTMLDREIEHFDGTAKELDAWVKTDLSSTADTTLYMYYNGPDVANSTATWDANYKMVQHLQEDPTNTLQDSTVYGNDGTSYGGMASGDQIAGQINGSLAFDGTEGIDCGSDGSLKPTSTVTMDFWMNPDSYYAYANPVMGFPGAGYKLWQWWNEGTPRVWVMELDQPTGTRRHNDIGLGLIPVSTWTHVSLVFDGQNGKLTAYKNGVLYDTQNRDAGAIGSYSGTFRIGNLFDGQIDEVRVSDIGRSGDWIEASYNTQNDPGGYLEFGAQQIPEPATLALIGGGLLALLRRRRKR